MFNVTPVTVELRLVPRSSAFFRIASGCAAAAGSGDSAADDWHQSCCRKCCFEFSFNPFSLLEPSGSCVDSDCMEVDHC